MTRKEELEARAKDYVSLFVMSGAEPAATKNLAWMLMEVEREVLERVKTVVAKKQASIHPEHTQEFKSGAGNVLYDVEQWLNSQQQELGS